MSAETKKKISEARKIEWNNPEYRKHQSDIRKGRSPEEHPFFGRKHSEETKKKLSIARKGTVTSEETKKKLSIAGKGLKRSKETRHRISEAKKGSKNPAWRGGISSDKYPRAWTKTLRKSIRERDDYCCLVCGEKQEKITHHVHHVNLDKTDLDPMNLITLCQSCHAKTYRQGELWITYFKNLISTQKENVA